MVFHEQLYQLYLFPLTKSAFPPHGASITATTCALNLHQTN